MPDRHSCFDRVVSHLPLALFRFYLAVASIALITGTTTADERREELIFPLQDQHVHSSSLVELPNGDLLCCWFHGSGERTANDVAVNGARLRNGSSEWSKLFPMADTPGLPDCNPVLFLDAKKRLWMFWIVPLANRWEHSVLKYRRAEDYQKAGPPMWSWQGTIHLQPGDEFARKLKQGFQELDREEGMWAEYAPPYARQLADAAHDPIKRQTGWMTRTHPLVLTNGRIVLPLYSDGFNVALMALSDDLGETWQASQPIVGFGPIQPTVVPKTDQCLVAYLRDSGDPPGRVLRSQSHNGGKSWTTAIDTAIPNPDSSLEVSRIQDGRWIMVLNDTERGRHRLSLACSDNEGKTWSWKRVLEASPNRQQSFEYPSLIQTRDGRIHITYSYVTPTGRTIKHTSVTTDWITNGARSEIWGGNIE